jgi:hypothetical protein
MEAHIKLNTHFGKKKVKDLSTVTFFESLICSPKT